MNQFYKYPQDEIRWFVEVKKSLAEMSIPNEENVDRDSLSETIKEFKGFYRETRQNQKQCLDKRKENRT